MPFYFYYKRNSIPVTSASAVSTAPTKHNSTAAVWLTVKGKALKRVKGKLGLPVPHQGLHLWELPTLIIPLADPQLVVEKSGSLAEVGRAGVLHSVDCCMSGHTTSQHNPSVHHELTPACTYPATCLSSASTKLQQQQQQPAVHANLTYSLVETRHTTLAAHKPNHLSSAVRKRSPPPL